MLPKYTYMRSPSVTGVSDAKLFLRCLDVVGSALRSSRSHRILPVLKSTSYATQRCTDVALTLPWSSPGSYRPLIGAASFPVLTAAVTKVPNDR